MGLTGLRDRHRSGVLRAQGGVKEASLQAVVIRADGTREPLGVVAYYHTNPIRRAWWRLTR